MMKWYTYEVIWIGKHSETWEILVVYKWLYDSISLLEGVDYWIRPLSMRDDVVEHNGQQVQRFTKIS